MALPVLIIAWNRPEKVAQALPPVLAYGPSYLYVAVDGPRDENPRDVELIAETNALISELVPGREIEVWNNPLNRGLRGNVMSSVSKFFELHTFGIILEDDVVASESFFEFCEELCERYSEDSKVGSISGSSHLPISSNLHSDFYFSRFQHVWGFATWRETWLDFLSFSKGAGWATTAEILGYWPNASPVFVDHWKKRINAELSGESDTWSAMWNRFTFARDRLCVVPKFSLTSNIGFGAGSTNARKIPLIAGYPPQVSHRLSPPFRAPREFDVSEAADAYVANTQWGTQSLLARIVFASLETVRRWIHKLGPVVPVNTLSRLVSGRDHDSDGPYLTVAQLFYQRKFLRMRSQTGKDED